MSTRCQIGVYEDAKQTIDKPSALLYKHSDGYPDGVIPIIQPFCQMFQERRGMSDTEYLAAWLMHALVQDAIAHNREYAGKYSHVPSDGKDCLGYGICDGFHGDIEFFYRIHPAEILVYETEFDADPKDFKLIDRIPISTGLKAVK